jgi:hypothetical protein
MAKKFKDSDILDAMAMHLDEDSVVFGANGHYAIGAYYDITKVSSVFGDKDYNSQSNIDDADSTEAAVKFRTNNDELAEELQKAEWLKNF